MKSREAEREHPLLLRFTVCRVESSALEIEITSVIYGSGSLLEMIDQDHMTSSRSVAKHDDV